MATLTTAAFLSKWATYFADNTSREISEEDMRDFRQDISDSFLNLTDQGYDGVKGIKSGINTIAGLQAIVTVGLSTGSNVLFRDTDNDDAFRAYELVAGTDAESSPDITRPTDYATTTNEKVWKLAAVGSGGGTAATTTFIPAGNISATDVQAALEELDTEKQTAAQVAAAIAAVVDSSPATLDTLNELAAALGDDPNFAATTATAIGNKVAKAGDTMSGNLALGGNKVTGLAAASGNGEAVRYEQVQAAFAPIPSTGTAIVFDIPRHYGDVTAETGNITLNSSGLIKGITQLARHNNSSTPSFGSEFKVISGAYVINVDNYIFMYAYSSSIIFVTITQI
jgi:hypothetical protein